MICTTWPRSRLLLRAACVAVLGLAEPVLAVAATDPSMAALDAGTWDIIFEKGNRRCRINLERAAVPGGFALAMPAGCHRAFPALAAVKAWAPAEGDHLVFETEDGQPVVEFGPTGGPALSAVASETDVYMLVPTATARQESLAHPVVDVPDVAASMEASAAGKPIAPAPVKPKPVVLKPATAAEVAGHYAVLRLGRDTGCMVTLDDEAKGKAGLRAKLAPACRDQGIVIFDPVGWQLVKGELVLTAKKGHTTVLSEQDERTWANAPAKGAALVLKRL